MDNPQNQMLGQGLHQFVMEAFDQHKDEFADKMFIEEFRVQVSLGSKISSISNLATTGLKVAFSDGDVCDKVTGKLYSSEIDFVCLPEDKTGPTEGQGKGSLFGQDDKSDHETPVY